VPGCGVSLGIRGLCVILARCEFKLTMHFESGPGSHPKIFQGLPRTSRDVQQQALITELSVLLFSANDY